MPNPRLGNLIYLLGMVLCFSQYLQAEEDFQYHIESNFEQAVNRPLNANADRATLRKYLQRLSTVQQVAIVLDRRIDPAQPIDVAVAAEFFDDGIRELVRQTGSEISIVADTIFVGPPQTALFLNTRIEFARDELDEVKALSPKRQFELLRRYEVNWQNLASPQEILAKLADRYQVRIENLEEVPHDLWTSGTIAHPNFIEASLLILSQYGLTIEWVDSEHVRFIKEQADVGILQSHRPKGVSLETAVALVKEKFPDLDLQPYKKRLQFTGTVEQHKAVAILVGEKRSTRQRKTRPVSGSLRDRRFTFKMIQKPFGSLMATLKLQGVDVRYDPVAIREANIDLGKLITLELSEATIDQLLEKSCEKVGLDYKIEGNLIELVVPE